MMLLVSGTSTTVSRLAPQWPLHLGHLITPANRNSIKSLIQTGLKWAADNGCYNGLDEPRFVRMLNRITGQPGLLWVVCPDKVADARQTREMWVRWLPSLHKRNLPTAFVLQDGQENLSLPNADAYFIGGSTRWKLSSTAADLATEVKRRGKWLHMGRVNSRRRIEVAYMLGCDSIDGSSASMFGDMFVPKYLRWIKQMEHQGNLFKAEAKDAKSQAC